MGKIQYLIEVKAIGLTLRENHLRQAIGYGSQYGIPWVVLTNGARWEIYKIRFEKPVTHDHVCSIDILNINPRKVEDQEALYLLCKEGLAKAAIEEFHEHVQLINRFTIGAIIQSDPVLDVIRRELKRLSPGIRVEKEEIATQLEGVLKRDILESEQATAARRQVGKASGKVLRKVKKANRASDGVEIEPPVGQPVTVAVGDPVPGEETL